MLSHAILAYRNESWRNFSVHFVRDFLTTIQVSESQKSISAAVYALFAMFLRICHTSVCLPIDCLGLTVLCYHNNRSWSEGAIVDARSVSFTNCSLTRKLFVRFGNNPRDKLNHFKGPSLDLSYILEFLIIFGPKCQNPAGSFWKWKRFLKEFSA